MYCGRNFAYVSREGKGGQRDETKAEDEDREGSKEAGTGKRRVVVNLERRRRRRRDGCETKIEMI